MRTDNGEEYISKDFQDFCAKRGIKRQLTTLYTPAQNGVAERMNRTIQERVTSMLSMANLSLGFWMEVVYTAVHIINRSPSTPLDFQILEKLWLGKEPHYNHLRVFGCEAYAHVPKELRSKLNPKSHKCIFVGYGAEGEMGYRLWHPESNKVILSSDVIFNESQMHKQPTKEVEYRQVTFEDVETAPTQGASDVPSTSVAPERAESSSQALR